MPRKKPIATAEPKPTPPTDDEIRAAFVGRAHEEIAVFKETKEKFLAGFAENPANTFQWRTEGVVAAQETAKLWSEAIDTFGMRGTLGLDFGLILQWVEHELHDELRCRRWEHSNTNPITNAVRTFGVSARVRAYLDIRMRARLALGQIEERGEE